MDRTQTWIRSLLAALACLALDPAAAPADDSGGGGGLVLEVMQDHEDQAPGIARPLLVVVRLAASPEIPPGADGDGLRHPPIHWIVCLDAGEAMGPHLQAARDAVEALAASSGRENRISLVTFSVSDARLRAVALDPQEGLDRILGILDDVRPAGRTDLGSAISKIEDLLAQPRLAVALGRDDFSHHALLLTPGRPIGDPGEAFALSRRVADLVARREVVLDALGLGPAGDQALLESLTRAGNGTLARLEHGGALGPYLVSVVSRSAPRPRNRELEVDVTTPWPVGYRSAVWRDPERPAARIPSPGAEELLLLELHVNLPDHGPRTVAHVEIRWKDHEGARRDARADVVLTGTEGRSPGSPVPLFLEAVDRESARVRFEAWEALARKRPYRAIHALRAFLEPLSRLAAELPSDELREEQRLFESAIERIEREDQEWLLQHFGPAGS